MTVSKNNALWMILIISLIVPLNATSQALQSEALAENRRGALLETLDRILYEQYEVLASDRSAESMHIELLVKDQLILWDRIKEAQKFLTYYDVAELMNSLAINYYLVRERMTELSFQPETMIRSAAKLESKLSEYVDIVKVEEPSTNYVEEIPDVAQPRGVLLQAAYTGEAISLANGGVDQGIGTAQKMGVSLTMDLDQMIGSQGSSLFFNAFYNQGANSVTEMAGSLQGISNIAAPDAFRLYEAWYEQYFFSGAGSIRAGLYELNSEFYALKSAGLFLNGAYSIGPEFAGTGINGPSIFPITSLAVRLSFMTIENAYVKTALLDGVPGDPDDPSRTHISLSHEEGALWNTEVGYIIGEPGNESNSYLKAGLGYWMYTAPFEEISSDPDADAKFSEGNSGVYGLIESTVFREKSNSAEGLTMFGRLGYASTTYNRIGLAWGAGLVYTGLIPGRTGDTIGLAISTAHAGSKFLDANNAIGIQSESFESVVEFSYKLSLNDWLSIQPDVQYLINPGLGVEANSALTIGSRFGISF